VSDLTGPGTFQLGDLAPGVIGVQPPLEPASSSPKDFVALGSSVLFAASGEESGRELWITEATVESTRVLADLCAGPCSSSPDDLVALSGTVFFAANDGVSGRELWRTDGTSAGTALALDLVPGPGGSNPRHLQEMGGRLLFFASVGSDEEALWRWAPAGTSPELVAELSVAGAPSFVTASTQAGERLYFVVANQVTGPELWGSDGTPAGTAALELRPGPLGSYTGSFLTVGEQLLFAAEDGIHGRELWIADGAEVRLLTDVVPGSRSSLPTELAATRETLFFSADDGVRGRELWSLPHESDGGGEEFPPVPDTPPILSEAFPGFRFWVRITAGGAEQPVRREAACIPETLCVSGAVPGRSELFLRIVGPKPNGRLWPTLVRFSTSTIEVWIEQEATGSLRYYRLEGATPGSSDLTGLFDREGFVPQG
jgi:ELWxxDGT repeat protein